MAIAVLFSPPSMTSEQYQETLRRVDAAGEGPNSPGKVLHLCFTDGQRVRVLDVWESAEGLERFGGILRPILQEVGIDPGQPEIFQVVNVEVSPQPAVA